MRDVADAAPRRVRVEGGGFALITGDTGTGKSATTAWLVEKVQRPTLVMAPNKTLAAQLAALSFGAVLLLVTRPGPWPSNSPA